MSLKNPFAVIIISHVNPVLRSAGNQIRILKMINWLRSEGAHVVLLLNHPELTRESRKHLLDIVDAVYTPHECSAPITKKISNIVGRLFFRKPKPLTNSEKLRAHLGSPYLRQATGVLCKRYMPRVVFAEYVFATPCLLDVPSDVLKIVDTHDLMSKRDPTESFYCSTDEEREFLLNADVVIAIQDAEAKQFRALVPERKVITVGIDYELVHHGKVEDIHKNNVLVVGSHNPKNISGLKAFCEHAWPLVCRKNPQAKLLVVGKVGEGLPNTVPRMSVLGWVDNVQTMYRQAAAVINPTTSGTGLKIKTVEALCNGKPLVATSNAVEGLDFGGGMPCVVCDNWPEFAEALISILDCDEHRQALEESSLRYARAHFSSRKVYAHLASIIRNQGK